MLADGLAMVGWAFVCVCVCIRARAVQECGSSIMLSLLQVIICADSPSNGCEKNVSKQHEIPAARCPACASKSPFLCLLRFLFIDSSKCEWDGEAVKDLL